MVWLLKSIYRLIPTKLKKQIVGSRFNIYLYIIYSFIISRTQKFYSQTGEDKLLVQFLPETTGAYIDIGAGQPVRGSNTYYFYKKGWNGCLIEPVEFNQNLIRKFRKRDNSLKAIVSSKTTDMNFYEFYPAEYSTIIEKVVEDLVRRGVKLMSIKKVRSTSLRKIGLEMTPEKPTFINIDVEGADLDVLKSNNWKITLPRVICIEESNNQNHGRTKISEYLTKVGYSRVKSTGLSSIYLHNSYTQYER